MNNITKGFKVWENGSLGTSRINELGIKKEFIIHSVPELEDVSRISLAELTRILGLLITRYPLDSVLVLDSGANNIHVELHEFVAGSTGA